jgi:2-polyprenyl-3-methyl-5-hydroxy-6-metoxy-1,4-benzoquinol methylase
MGTREHWEDVYRTKQPSEVSWYLPHLAQSLRLIADANADPDARIIDVGSGESTLPDDLLARGYRRITILDLSATALEVSKARLGANAARINWLQGDVTTCALPAQGYDVWHDRAVFHFLTDPRDRIAYVRQVANAVKAGGHVIVATFAEDGPTQCSGLPVVRYSADALHAEFGVRFELERHVRELHHTPAGRVQSFVYCYCRKADC